MRSATADLALSASCQGLNLLKSPGVGNTEVSRCGDPGVCPQGYKVMQVQVFLRRE